MADENAVDSFLDLLRQSDLVSDDQILALTAESSGADTGPHRAQKLADELVKREVLTAWQADMLLQGKHRGFHLGPYRILRPLGQGGMSKVFLGEHKVMRRCCAIKVLPSKYEEDPDLLNRFQLEARAIAALDHPNIVRAYDFNKDLRYGKDMHYLVMEYVDGPDLRRLVDEQGPLDYRKAADFICQAAEGLAHAHAAGFVHRDIKPANLLVDPHGVLKVLDLGLARFNFEAEQGLNASEGSQSAVGTADYIAPEQVVDSRHVDGRADIYSLGHTFYFLLTGHRPFTKPTIMELLMAHRAEEPEPIGKTRPDVPMELESIVAKMTAKSPIQRYQTAKEVAETLRTWLHESGSGRGYSRISALMAEAMRAKQFAGQDTTRMKSTATEDTDLELATLDDEPTRSRGAAGAKTADSDRGKTVKATGADGKDKDRQPVLKDSPAPGAKKNQTSQAKSEPTDKTAAPGGAQPADASEEATLPSIKADLLSAPLAEALVTEALPAEPLPAATGQGPLQELTPLKPKGQPKPASMLKSPWLWVGLAGLILVAVVLPVVILISSTSTEEPAGPPAVPQTTPAPGPLPQETATVSPAKPDESPKTEPPKTGRKRSRGESRTPGQDNGEKSPPSAGVKEAVRKTTTIEAATPPAVTAPMTESNDSKQPEAVQPPQPPPAQGEKGRSRRPRPAAAETAEVKRPQPAPPPKEEVVDKEALLAGITTITFRFKSFDNDPRSRLNALVQRQAITAADQQLKLTVVGQDAPMMEIELKANTAADSSSVVMSAELKCLTQNGKTVTVWQNSKTLLSGKIRLTPPLSQGLLKGARDPVGKFFDQFVEDVRQAQSKAGAN